jgi:hypothetical protein
VKKVILSKIEYEFLVECLEKLEKLEKQTDNSLADPKWSEKLDTTQRLYELEMEYYKIKKYGEPSTKYDMVRWLLTKVKSKTLDF